MSYYGMPETKKKAGHWLCEKCHTWNRDYGKSATKSVVACPFCSNPKPPTTKETAEGGEPTQVDLDLFQCLKNASESDITRIKKFANITSELFTYMKTASLAEKTKILKFTEDEL